MYKEKIVTHGFGGQDSQIEQLLSLAFWIYDLIDGTVLRANM